jgi:hypothetical protein
MRPPVPAPADRDSIPGPAPFRWVEVEVQGSAGRLGRPNHVTIVPVRGDRSRDPAAVRRLLASLVASGVLSVVVLSALLTFY